MDPLALDQRLQVRELVDGKNVGCRGRPALSEPESTLDNASRAVTNVARGQHQRLLDRLALTGVRERRRLWGHPRHVEQG